jgi:hypothetical protein
VIARAPDQPKDSTARTDTVNTNRPEYSESVLLKQASKKEKTKQMLKHKQADKVKPSSLPVKHHRRSALRFAQAWLTWLLKFLIT